LPGAVAERQHPNQFLSAEPGMLPIILSPPHGERESRYSGGYTRRTYGSHRRTGIDVIQL